MDEPTFDRSGYPTEETLKAIETWPTPLWVESMVEAMDFVGRAWSYPDRWVKERLSEDGRSFIAYRFSTGGWSGNESLVRAIEENTILQAIGAWSWRRGGHYEYRFPVKEEHDATAVP